eukprot:1925808-Pleurochrysis_carterae.AAC.1
MLSSWCLAPKRRSCSLVCFGVTYGAWKASARDAGSACTYLRRIPSFGCWMQDKDGNIIKYLLGWVFAPAYTIQNLPHWPPVDAVDACHAKYPGQGTFY